MEFYHSKIDTARYIQVSPPHSTHLMWTNFACTTRDMTNVWPTVKAAAKHAKEVTKTPIIYSSSYSMDVSNMEIVVWDSALVQLSQLM